MVLSSISPAPPADPRGKGFPQASTQTKGALPASIALATEVTKVCAKAALSSYNIYMIIIYNIGINAVGKRRQGKDVSVYVYVWVKQPLGNNDIYKH